MEEDEEVLLQSAESRSNVGAPTASPTGRGLALKSPRDEGAGCRRAVSVALVTVQLVPSVVFTCTRMVKDFRYAARWEWNSQLRNAPSGHGNVALSREVTSRSRWCAGVVTQELANICNLNSSRCASDSASHGILNEKRTKSVSVQSEFLSAPHRRLEPKHIVYKPRYQDTKRLVKYEAADASVSRSSASRQIIGTSQGDFTESTKEICLA
ncbi:hypothetical protein FGB62_28g133 [Gracilaria domingensis]|nr:hypothetical protein FGB62_28g133 [Gracilaria domingensis]